MMGCAMKIMEQFINLWKTTICKCIAVLVSHILTFQNVPVLIAFFQIPLHLLSHAYAGSRIQNGIQITMDMFKLFISVLLLNLPFGRRKSTLGQGPGTVSSTFICD